MINLYSLQDEPNCRYILAFYRYLYKAHHGNSRESYPILYLSNIHSHRQSTA